MDSLKFLKTGAQIAEALTKVNAKIAEENIETRNEIEEIAEKRGIDTTDFKDKQKTKSSAAVIRMARSYSVAVSDMAERTQKRDALERLQDDINKLTSLADLLQKHEDDTNTNELLIRNLKLEPHREHDISFYELVRYGF